MLLRFLNVRACVLAIFTLMYAYPALASNDLQTGTDVTAGSTDVSVSNDYYNISLLESTKQFSVRTGASHSAGANLNVIYHQDSSFLTVRAYEGNGNFVDYTQKDLNKDRPTEESANIAKQLVLSSATQFSDGFRVIYTTGISETHNLQVIQDIRLEGAVERTSSVRVTTRVTSLSATTKRIAVRYLWDFEIGDDDGPALVLENGSQITEEKEFDNPTMTHFIMQDNESANGQPKLRVRGTVNLGQTGPYETKPTRLTHACWETARWQSFDYPVEPFGATNQPRVVSSNNESCDIENTGGDNAMLYYFGHDFDSATSINRNETVIFTAYLAKEIASNTQFDKTDSDGDAIYDIWETNGVDLNGDGTAEYTLDGADKDKKNLYIYYDWVGDNEPDPISLTRVISAFQSAPDGGIVLKFIKGKKVTKVEGVDIDATIGETDKNNVYSWEEFAKIKAENFPTKFWPVYRYMLVADRYSPSGSSGIARGIPSSDFMVTVGSWGKTGEEELRIVANTIMHELGHTLALRHGGFENANRKPNYLSIMNYSFQLTGIPHSDGAKLDYSRFGSGSLATLNEKRLSEISNLKLISTAGPIDKYSTTVYCKVKQGEQPASDARTKTINSKKYTLADVPVKNTIDWNCDGSKSVGTSLVSADVNPDTGISEALGPHHDWNTLVFDGGAIGELGAVLDLPIRTDLKVFREPTVEEYEALKNDEFIDNSESLFLLKDGGFEQPYDLDFSQGAYLYFQAPDNTQLGDWSVSNINVTQGFGQPAEGQRYIDLNGRNTGSISQTISTEVGENYILTFAMSGDSSGTSIKEMAVHLNGAEANTYIFDASETSSNAWQRHQLTFTATSSETTIEFRSNISGVFGPWLDDIRLEYEIDEFRD